MSPPLPPHPLPPPHALPLHLRPSPVPGGPKPCLNSAVLNSRRALPLPPSKVNLLTGGKEGEQESRSQRSFNNRPGGKSPRHHHLPPRCILGCIFPINRLQWLRSPSGPPDKVCQSNVFFFFLKQSVTQTHTHTQVQSQPTQTHTSTRTASLIVTLEGGKM